MDIKEVRKKQKKLISEIEELLFEFTSETGCVVSDCYISDTLFSSEIGKDDRPVIRYYITVRSNV